MGYGPIGGPIFLTQVFARKKGLLEALFFFYTSFCKEKKKPVRGPIYFVTKNEKKKGLLEAQFCVATEK